MDFVPCIELGSTAHNNLAHPRKAYHQRRRLELVALEKIDPTHPRVIAFRAPLKKWRAKNKDREAEKSHVRYWLNPEKYRKQSSDWIKANRPKVAASVRKRLSINPLARITKRLRDRLYQKVKRAGANKAAPTMELLGCGMDEFKAYLAEKFQVGMTWDNHGRFGWHIDHIKPCSSFDLTDPEQQRACFHYTNLQPLWWSDNLSKSDKIIPFPGGHNKPTPELPNSEPQEMKNYGNI